MSRLGINTGNNPNDGQGDPLRVAMGKINSNFLEVYNTFGNGFTLTSYASTAGISTVAQNLTGSPRINVSGILNTGITTTEHLEVRNITSIGVVTATGFVGDGSQLTNVTSTASGVSIYDDNVFLGVARELNFDANIVSTSPDGTQRVRISASGYATTAGIATYASTAGVATVAQGLTGTPNINVGVVTATSYRGSGVNLTGVITSLVAGTNVTITQSSGIATISAATTSGGSGNYAIIAGYSTSSGIATFAGYSTSSGIATFATIAGYSTSSGISTVAQGLTGTPNISVNQVGIASFLSVTGVTTFFNNVHFDYDKYVLIGSNDELQLFHNGSNSYIENTSTNNLIVRTTGGAIVFQKVGPENMGVFNTDGSVELYFDNSKKFETTGYGATIFGGLNISGVATATSFVGSGSNLTGLTGATASTYGNGTAVPQIVVDSNGRITSITNVAISTGGVGGGGTSGIYVNDGTLVGFAGTINFGDGLSVTPLSAGIVTANVTYAPIAGYSTSSGVSTTSQGLTGTPNITVGSIISGNINSSGIITATSFAGSGTNLTGIVTSIVAGTNVTISASTGQVTINASGAGGSSQWSTVASGIITASNVGIATTNATSALTVVGDGSFTGVVTANRFQSTTAGTPTIDSPNNVNINANTVAISTDTTVGRELRVAGITTVNAGGVRVAGVVTATTFIGALIATGSAPASSSSTGTAGEIRYDANYIYICTATNTWKRVGIATW